MKNITVLLGLFLAAGVAVAEPDSKNKDAMMSAAVVSVDASSKTITVRATDASSSPSVTLPVQGKATDALKDVKAGDTVSLTCRAESRQKASTTSSASAGSPFAACTAVTEISKAPGAGYSSASPSTAADPFGAPAPVTAPPTLGSSPSSGASASILQGGTINPDQPSLGALSGTTSTTATDAKTRASQPADTSATIPTAATAKIDAVVVSADSSAKTITLRSASGAKSPATTTDAQPSLTLPVEGQASAKLRDVKAGDRVSVTCRTSAASSSSSAADWTQASQCSVVTEIATAKARTSDEPATSKTRSTTPELMEPGLVVPKK
jgi:Cu/Ag efflux protein CusF